MSLQAAIEQALPTLRAEAEAMMTLTLAAYSPTGKTVDGNGKDVLNFAPEGTPRGKVQASSQQGGDTPTRYLNIGGVDRPVLTGGLHVPISAPVPTAGEQRGKGWEYVVTAVADPADAALLDRRYLVVAVPAKSFATARRLDVIEL